MEKILLVGLGNPGKDFANTRHNAGRLWAENVALHNGAKLDIESKFNSLVGKSGNLVICLPETFMNLSGTSVQKVMSYLDISPERLLVAHDEVDLPAKSFKVAFGSRPAGHHGVEDIVNKIGTLNFWRLRIGVGRPEDSRFDVSEFVLGKLTPDELQFITGIDWETVRAAITPATTFPAPVTTAPKV